jgi:hypothetical protein
VSKDTHFISTQRNVKLEKKGLGKLVDTVIRTLKNIYVLNEIGKEMCCLGKENEGWL